MLKIIPLLFTALLLTSCGNDGSTDPHTWTFLVYMDGDNNLAQASLADISEMEAVGPSDNVRIVVQLDLNGGYTTKRFLVKKGMLEELSDLGELDMASPDTLTGFLSWARTYFPSDRTVLVLWNHGNGWDQGDGPSQPVTSHQSPVTSYRSILYDDDNRSRFLSNHRVKKAIQDSGIRLDILGLDASIMGTVEALYEFRELAPVIISSQEVGESHGWDYYSILSRLEANPNMLPEDLSMIVVDRYRAFFEDIFYPANPNYERRHTISAMRTGKLLPLGEEVDALAARMISLLDNPLTRGNTLNLIKGARENVQGIDYYVQPYVYVDLADLSRLLNQYTNIERLVSEATLAEYHGSARGEAHGISIVFFKLPEADRLTYDPNYKNYDPVTNTGNGGDFINQFRWDEFLARYYSYAGLLSGG